MRSRNTVTARSPTFWRACAASTLTYDHDYSFVGVRGFGRLGDYNIRTLVLVDGHRINDNIFGEAYVGSEFLVDVEVMERVEILRGPSSSLYGADAFFAVIKANYPQTAATERCRTLVRTGQFGTYQGRPSYGGQYRGATCFSSERFTTARDGSNKRNESRRGRQRKSKPQGFESCGIPPFRKEGAKMAHPPLSKHRAPKGRQRKLKLKRPRVVESHLFDFA
jgi:TonB-dependent Receptor Plug Domain